MAMHTRFFNALTNWITHLASRLVPSHIRVADHSPTTGGSVKDNAEDKSLKKIFIPNALARWPWPRRLNQYYPEVDAESTAWIASFKPFSPKAQDAFERCKFNLLGCLAYLTARKEHVRAGCDHMNLVFVIDEYSDASGEDEVRNQKNIVMDALRNPHNPRPKGEWVGGEMHRQFWERTIPYATVQSQKRFIAAMDEYLEGVVQQAIDRHGHLIRDIRSYHDVRSRTVGVKPAYAILELGLDIPDEIMSHPSIKDMSMASIEMIYLYNDFVSYNIEQARDDDDHNIVTIAMHELDTDVNGAMLWVANRYADLEKKFLEAMSEVPQWGEPIDSQVREYCDGMGNWVQANSDWHFESERYFGTKGLEIKRRGWMLLMSKIGTRENAVGPVLVDSLL